MKRKMKQMMKEQGDKLQNMENLPKSVPKSSASKLNMVMDQNASQEEKLEQQNIYLGSLQRIIDDYAPPLNHPSLFSKEGLKSRKKEIQNTFMSYYFLYQLRSKNPGTKIDKKSFLVSAEKIYLAYNHALASRDTNVLSSITTPDMFSNVKDIIKKKPLPKGVTQEWIGKVSKIRLVNVRYVEMDGMKNHFCQMTAQITSQQRARILKEEKTVKETDDTTITENWVFEIIVNKENDMWKYCGSIALE